MKKTGRKAVVDDVPIEVPAEVISATVAEALGQRPEPPYTYAAVLSFVGKKISQGFKPQIQALFNSYGARKFSEVDPSYYGDLVEAVAGLSADSGGDDHA